MGKLIHFCYPILVGMLLGLMQTGLFLQLSFTLSSSLGTYLMVTLAWLIGSAIGALALSQKSLRLFLLISLLAYAGVNLLVNFLPFRTEFWLLYALAVVLMGLYPGVFFGRMADYYPARLLFFRENNGFIMGIVIGTILFMLYGRIVLYALPLALVCFLFIIPERILEETTQQSSSSTS